MTVANGLRIGYACVNTLTALLGANASGSRNISEERLRELIAANLGRVGGDPELERSPCHPASSA